MLGQEEDFFRPVQFFHFFVVVRNVGVTGTKKKEENVAAEMRD